MPRQKTWRTRALLLFALVAAVPVLHGQTTRKATTVSALLKYPVFFHGQPIVVRGQWEPGDDTSWLASGEQKVRIVGKLGSAAAGIVGDVRSGESGNVAAVGTGADSGPLQEIRGVFWDIGRLEPGDPRLNPHDFAAVAQKLSGRAWPAVGEVLIVIAESAEPATPPAAPTIRAIGIDPGRYDQQRVTLTGRFRGRNLFGDLPQAPGKSQWDFVLQFADAALWVTGLRPRGKGFDLDVNSRLDTNRWLEVAGVVRSGNGLVWLEAAEVRPARAPQDAPAAAEEAIVKPPPPPLPEVVFSAPVSEETDVPRETKVRVQFSRDMDRASFRNQVRVSYVDGAGGAPGASTDPAPAAPDVTTEYQEGNRVLEIRFVTPLERFRTVKIELLDGIKSRGDGQTLKPWSLTFVVGP